MGLGLQDIEETLAAVSRRQCLEPAPAVAPAVQCHRPAASGASSPAPLGPSQPQQLAAVQQPCCRRSPTCCRCLVFPTPQITGVCSGSGTRRRRSSRLPLLQFQVKRLFAAVGRRLASPAVSGGATASAVQKLQPVGRVVASARWPPHGTAVCWSPPFAGRRSGLPQPIAGYLPPATASSPASVALRAAASGFSPTGRVCGVAAPTGSVMAALFPAATGGPFQASSGSSLYINSNSTVDLPKIAVRLDLNRMVGDGKMM